MRPSSTAAPERSPAAAPRSFSLPCSDTCPAPCSAAWKASSALRPAPWTIASAAPLLVLGALGVLGFLLAALGGGNALQGLPILPLPLSLYLFCESAIRLGLAFLQEEPTGSLAGVTLYALWRRFCERTTSPRRYAPGPARKGKETVWNNSAGPLALAAALIGAALVAPAQDAPAPSEPRKITVTAKKYEFNPPRIELKAGETVEITFEAEDTTHGIICKELGIEKVVFEKGKPETVKVPRKSPVPTSSSAPNSAASATPR